jgi:pSer/pThr/pTyr-binding forkhead associated (FHA) protein
MQADTSAVSLIRQLPWDQSPVESTNADAVRSEGQPTHLLFNNRAFSIDAQALTLGSKSGGGERYIELRQDMPGVSRRHCSVSQENGQCIVRDHSRYGTFLNGHRIDGSAVLQIGDLIRLGTPGFEMRMITTASDDGS